MNADMKRLCEAAGDAIREHYTIVPMYVAQEVVTAIFTELKHLDRTSPAMAAMADEIAPHTPASCELAYARLTRDAFVDAILRE